MRVLLYLMSEPGTRRLGGSWLLGGCLAAAQVQLRTTNTKIKGPRQPTNSQRATHGHGRRSKKGRGVAIRVAKLHMHEGSRGRPESG